MMETFIYDFVVEMMNFFSLLLHNRSVSFGVCLGHLFRAALTGSSRHHCVPHPMSPQEWPSSFTVTVNIYPACLFSVLTTSQNILYLPISLLVSLSVFFAVSLLSWTLTVMCHVFQAFPWSCLTFSTNELNTIFIPTLQVTALNLTWSRFHSKNR